MANLGFSSGSTLGLSAPEPKNDTLTGSKGSDILLGLSDIFSGLGAAFGGPPAGPSRVLEARNQKLREDQAAQERLIFEQQQFQNNMGMIQTLMGFRSALAPDKQKEFDKQAPSFLGGDENQFSKLYKMGVASQGNTQVINDLLGGEFEQDPILQRKLQQLGPLGFVDWTLKDEGQTYLGQLKSRKFGPTAKAKVNQLVSAGTDLLPSKLRQQIQKDGVTSVAELDQINTALEQKGSPLAFSEAELEYIKSDEGLNYLNGIGIVPNEVVGNLMEFKRQKQLEALYREPKEGKDRFVVRGNVMNKDTGKQVGSSVYDRDSNRVLVMEPDGTVRPRDPNSEFVTADVTLEGKDIIGTKTEMKDFRDQQAATQTFFDVMDELVTHIEKTPAALGDVAEASTFLSGVKTQVQTLSNLLGVTDFDLSADPEDYEGIFKDLGLLGAEHAATRTYLTSLAFMGAAAQGLGAKSVDSEKEMNRLLRQVGAGARSVPELKKSISAFADVLRRRLVNKGKTIGIDINLDQYQTPLEQDEAAQIDKQIQELQKAIDEEKQRQQFKHMREVQGLPPKEPAAKKPPAVAEPSPINRRTRRSNQPEAPSIRDTIENTLKEFKLPWQ